MSLTVLIQNALVENGSPPMDIGIRNGKIAVIDRKINSDAFRIDAEGKVVIPGLVETHIHLDKSRLCDRCGPSASLKEAIAVISGLKSDMTENDIYERARHTLLNSIVQGTTVMRAHVEVDPKIGLRGFHAMRRLKHEFAWAISLQICVFPQEGLVNYPGCLDLLLEACANGADLIGGCPYGDTHPEQHIDCIFEIARTYDLDIDFHLDFDIDPGQMDLHHVCRKTETTGWGGRVTIGHVTKLSAIPPAELGIISARLRDAGVAVTVLPATDLFLIGRDAEWNVPRGIAPVLAMSEHGVTCSVATNNVLNPFTPFGDCSLIRMANMMLNVSQRGDEAAAMASLDMISASAARLMNLTGYGIAVGKSADLTIVNACNHASVVAEIAEPLVGLKAGKITFTRSNPQIHWPDGGEHPLRSGGAVTIPELARMQAC